MLLSIIHLFPPSTRRIVATTSLLLCGSIGVAAPISTFLNKPLRVRKLQTSFVSFRVAPTKPSSSEHISTISPKATTGAGQPSAVSVSRTEDDAACAQPHLRWPHRHWTGPRLAPSLFALAKQLNVEITNDVTTMLVFDSAPFSERNIPSITINSLTKEAMDAQTVKSPKDKISALRFDDYYQTYKLVAAYLVLLDQISRAHTK